MAAQNVIALNVNSIKAFNKKISLEIFVKNNGYPGIVLLSETNLKPGDNFNMNGYNIFRQDRIKSNGGGTAILLNNKINFRNIKKY